MPDTRIPHSQVPFIGKVAGIITREWFRFLYAIYNLTGANGNTTSIQDTQSGPLASDQSLAAQVAELRKQIQALQSSPPIYTGYLDGVEIMTLKTTLNFPNTAPGACSDIIVNVPNVSPYGGDGVFLGMDNTVMPANGTFFAWPSNAGQVTVRYANNDPLIAYDPPSATFRIIVIRPPY